VEISTIVEPLKENGYLVLLSSPISIASYPFSLESITSLAVIQEFSFEILALVPAKKLQYFNKFKVFVLFGILIPTVFFPEVRIFGILLSFIFPIIVKGPGQK
jgi:hypothetical protein